MIQLILVRHGVTQWNENRKYIGVTDLELTQKGVLQAEAASNRLRNESFVSVYSSDTNRALETAEIISRPHELEVNTLSDLNEVDFGQWEGLTFVEIDERWPNFIYKWLMNEDGFPPDGEQIESFRKRVENAVRRILKQNQSGNVVVVAHAGTIKLITCYLLGLDLLSMWKMRHDSGGITRIEVDDEGTSLMTVLNDVCHLNHLSP